MSDWRSRAEIIARIRALGKESWGGVALIELLPYKLARPYLDDSFDEGNWDHYETPEEAMRSYMTFAVDKLLDGRVLAATRALARYCQWVWAHGDSELINRFRVLGGEGPSPHEVSQVAIKLKVVCEHFGIPLEKDLDRVIDKYGSEG